MKVNFQMLASLPNRFLGFWGFKLIIDTLKHCHLQVQNLDWIITMIDNWPNDPFQNCTPNANLKDYLKVEIVLVEENYELIKGAKFFKEL
jgi:hypothetical protein